MIDRRSQVMTNIYDVEYKVTYIKHKERVASNEQEAMDDVKEGRI